MTSQYRFIISYLCVSLLICCTKTSVWFSRTRRKLMWKNLSHDLSKEQTLLSDGYIRTGVCMNYFLRITCFFRLAERARIFFFRQWSCALFFVRYKYALKIFCFFEITHPSLLMSSMAARVTWCVGWVVFRGVSLQKLGEGSRVGQQLRVGPTLERILRVRIKEHAA